MRLRPKEKQIVKTYGLDRYSMLTSKWPTIMHSLREQNAIAKSIKYNKKENIILHYCGSDQCGVTV